MSAAALASSPAPAGRRGSLRRQLIAWNILALALLLGALGVVIRYTARNFLMDSVDGQLERDARHAPPLPPDHGRPMDRDGGGPPLFEGDEGPGDRRGFRGRRGPPGVNMNPYRWHHFDLQGRSVMADDTRPLWDPAAFALARQGQTRASTVFVDGESLRIFSAPAFERGRITAVIQSAYPLADVNLALAGMDRALLTLIPIGLLGAGMAGSLLTDRVLRRVRRTTQAAEQISARDFSARLPVSGNDEFSELAETFNGLLGRLEGAFQQQERLLEQQRRFTADASHELKTPLTVIKGTASMALAGRFAETTSRRSFQDIDRAADSMAHLVGDLLLLARSDGGQMGKNPISVPVREILERAISGVPRQGTPIEMDVEDEALCVTGNEMELIRLFSNLLDNAARCTPPEGAIRVTARAEETHVLVRIADTGVGIAPEHLPHLGERFYRVDAARSRPDGGSGLGLSICKSILEAHGGTLTITSAPGAGTTVSVSLPG